MAFVQLSDASADIELVLFPSTYEQTAWLWEQDKVVLIDGTVQARDRDGQITDDIKIIVSSAREIQIEEAKAYKETGKTVKSIKEKKPPKTKEAGKKNQQLDRIYIRLQSTNNADQLLMLKKHIDAFAGSSEVVLVVGESEAKQVIRLPDKTSREDASIQQLVNLFGAENVKLG